MNRGSSSCRQACGGGSAVWGEGAIGHDDIAPDVGEWSASDGLVPVPNEGRAGRSIGMTATGLPPRRSRRRGGHARRTGNEQQGSRGDRYGILADLRGLPYARALWCAYHSDGTQKEGGADNVVNAVKPDIPPADRGARRAHRLDARGAAESPDSERLGPSDLQGLTNSTSRCSNVRRRSPAASS